MRRSKNGGKVEKEIGLVEYFHRIFDQFQKSPLKVIFCSNFLNIYSEQLKV